MKISIVGAGAVGIDLCNYILHLGDCRELVLIDLNREKTTAEQLDFGHTSALSYVKNTHILVGDYEDAKDSDIIVITAGVPVKPTQNRLELAAINAPILSEIANHCHKVAPNAVLIIISNPCDILTHFVTKNSPYPPQRVISAGCVIDTARMLKIVADHVHLDPKSLSGFVLGEHGSHCFIPWSMLHVAGQPVNDFCRLNGYPELSPEKLLEEVKQIGFTIFRQKMNTNHGIAASVFRIIRAITINECSVLPVGGLVEDYCGIKDIVLNLPFVVGEKGIERPLIYGFTETEMEALHHTATVLRQVVDDVVKNTGLNG